MSARRIFISVCETSADVHAASLVRAARAAGHEWRFYGMTGPRLRALGVETVFDFASHAAMLSGVLGLIGRARRALATVEACWRRERPDVVVLLDSPELHLKLAARARRLGIPVLYYIAPQTWASRAYRNRQIARDIDRLACILPFEERYFRERCEGERVRGGAFRAEYVGHPLFEALAREEALEQTLAWLRERAAGRRTVALLPGSRRHVIEKVLPLQLDVVRRLRAGGQDVYAAISCADEHHRDLIRGVLATHCEQTAPAAASDEVVDPGIDIVLQDNASLLTAADLVLVASGTATLHVAHYRKPMIVLYDAGRLMQWLFRVAGRWLLTTPHLSLVNILARARVVPEFMPFVPDPAAVAEAARELLTDGARRERMIRELGDVVRPLEGTQASERVCALIRELTGT